MTTLAHPVRYSPAVGHCEPDEAKQSAELNATLRKILDKTFEDYGHAMRSVHAKSHGVLRCDLNAADIRSCTCNPPYNCDRALEQS